MLFMMLSVQCKKRSLFLSVEHFWIYFSSGEGNSAMFYFELALDK